MKRITELTRPWVIRILHIMLLTCAVVSSPAFAQDSRTQAMRRLRSSCKMCATQREGFLT